jgi:hypothetical protein
MRKFDWTPTVLVAATASLTVVAVVFLTTPWLRRSLGGDPGPERARRALADELSVWVGDLGGGLTAVLSAVWGDAEPDLAHDGYLNEGLALAGERRLAYYRLLLFNTSAEPRTVSLADGTLSIRRPGGRGDVPMQSVPGLVAAGEADPAPALARVLQSLGTLQDSVTVPGGESASLVVAFSSRVDLASADGVAAGSGATFRRRRILRRDFESLLAEPDEQRLRGL